MMDFKRRYDAIVKLGYLIDDIRSGYLYRDKVKSIQVTLESLDIEYDTDRFSIHKFTERPSYIHKMPFVKHLEMLRKSMMETMYHDIKSLSTADGKNTLLKDIKDAIKTTVGKINKHLEKQVDTPTITHYVESIKLVGKHGWLYYVLDTDNGLESVSLATLSVYDFCDKIAVFRDKYYIGVDYDIDVPLAYVQLAIETVPTIVELVVKDDTLRGLLKIDDATKDVFIAVNTSKLQTSTESFLSSLSMVLEALFTYHDCDLYGSPTVLKYVERISSQSCSMEEAAFKMDSLYHYLNYIETIGLLYDQLR